MDRPYFNYNINQLEELFEKNKGNPKELRRLNYELSHRKMPKARALRKQTDALLAHSNVDIMTTVPQLVAPSIPNTPSRVVVECGYCSSTNFVHISEGKQHLSCAHCSRPFIAEFAYGMLRTTFPPSSGKEAKSMMTADVLVIAGLLMFVLLILLAK